MADGDGLKPTDKNGSFLEWVYPTMVYFVENPNLKWMMTRGTPMTMETPNSAIKKLVFPS